MTAWEVADKEIARYWKALRFNPKANPKVCRKQIDKWLEYRSRHSATDLKAQL